MTLAAALARQRDDVGPWQSLAGGRERRSSSDQRPVDVEIVVGHPGDGETLLEAAPHGTAIEREDITQRPARFLHARHDATRDMIVDDLGNGAAAEPEHRCA